MSLLRSEGHPGAGEYPLWRVHHELEATRHRVNGRIASDLTLTTLAKAATRDKGMAKQLKEIIEDMTQ